MTIMINGHFQDVQQRDKDEARDFNKTLALFTVVLIVTAAWPQEPIIHESPAHVKYFGQF